MVANDRHRRYECMTEEQAKRFLKKANHEKRRFSDYI